MHIWELLIDIIFPPSPNELLVRSATLENITKEYCPSTKARVYYFSNYRRQLITALITTTKFSNNKKAIRLLAHLLTRWLEEHTKDNTLLIPIPLYSKRERERGYNQVTRVLEELELAHIKIESNLLKRNRNTVPQTTLERDDRTKNLKNAFVVNQKILNKVLTPDIKNVIICDDVYTTGSTLKEAKRVLTPHIPRHCELICLAWAH